MIKKLMMIFLFSAVTVYAAGTPGVDSEALGDSCLEMHDTFHALMYYNEALAADSSAKVRRKIADCYYMRGEYSRCVETMLPVAGPGGDSLNLKRLREMFFSYKALDNRDRQISWGNAIIRRCPLDAEITAAVAAIYNTDSVYSPSNARMLTARYLETDSTCIPVLRQYADSQFLLENFDDAISAYRRLLALGDSTFNTVYSLGMSYMQDSLYADARMCFLYAVQKSGMKNVGSLYRLGVSCLELDSLMEAVTFLSIAYQRLQPDGQTVYAIKRAEGEAYYKMESYWNAIYSWKDALKHNNYSLATIFNIAQAYGLAGNHKEEKNYYRSFLSLAVMAEKNDTLNEWIKQAEAVVGKLDLPKGVYINPPGD